MKRLLEILLAVGMIGAWVGVSVLASNATDLEDGSVPPSTVAASTAQTVRR